MIVDVVTCRNRAEMEEFLSDMGNAWQAGVWETYAAVLWYMMENPEAQVTRSTRMKLGTRAKVIPLKEEDRN